MVHPASPASAARRTVSATASGESPKPFSRSAETGTFDAAADLQFDRCSFKAEPLAQLIHEVTLVREVQRSGFVGNYDE